MLNKKKHEKINQNVNQNENKIIMVILIRATNLISLYHYW